MGKSKKTSYKRFAYFSGSDVIEEKYARHLVGIQL
jgi:hypothetical protein